MCGHVKMSHFFFLGDHEDAETAADTSPEQQEESVQTEEPVDLVTF